MRKYSTEQDSTRKALSVHHDKNQHSVNIALNSDTDFDGGGFFVVKPPPQQVNYGYNKLPSIPDAWTGLSFLEVLERKNSTEVYFPSIKAGHALLHNHTVFHGVAPIVNGAKFSLLIFFDMPSCSWMGCEEFQQVLEGGPIDIV